MRPIVINQHYIPRSYLKNFGFLVNSKKNKWSLYAMEYGGEIKRRTTENICAVEYLYDLPFAGGKEQQFLEHAYEEHADRHFGEITKFITDDANKSLDSSMREKILKSCLSLYFRTPKFVDLDQAALDEIQQLPESEQELAWKIKKTRLLEDSVMNFDQLYNSFKYSGISINKAVRDWEFISGDNPLIIRNRKNDVVDSFASANMIHIPLTPRYAITILPPNDVTLQNGFYRMPWDDLQVMSLNHSIEQYHQRFLLGSEKALSEYLKESPAYKAPAAPNDPRVLKVKGIQFATEGLVKMVAATNGVITKDVKAYFNWCWKNVPGFSDDPNAQLIKSDMD